MNRRELLKFSLLSPLLGLVKKKEPEGLKVKQLLECKKGLSKTDICNEALERISETTGTSSEGRFFTLKLKGKFLEDSPEVRQWLDEKERELNREYLLDPLRHWAKECSKEYNRANDEVIIKAIV